MHKAKSSKTDSSTYSNSSALNSHPQLAHRPYGSEIQKALVAAKTPTDIENEGFAEQQMEATGLSIQAKYGTITPEGQERLTVLQAKMDGLLNSRLEHATRFGHNIANIPLLRPDTPTPIQAKLTIGEPGDQYEQEADETARQVVQRIHQPQSKKLQRESLPDEEEELQMKPEGHPLLSVPQLLSTENTIQRFIDQNFSQSQKEANRENLAKFFREKVKEDLKEANRIVKDDLKSMSSTLKDYQETFNKRYSNAVRYNYPNNWKFAVTALDELVSYTNKIIMESTRPGVDIYDQNTDKSDWTPIPGEMTKEGIPDQWGYAKEDVLNAREYISFYHATTAKGKIENSQIKIMPGAKEFGEGFYTTATDIDTPAKKIGDKWFTEKQQNPDWVIIRFDIPKSYTSYLESKNSTLNEFLYYILSHTTGYPSGGATPNVQDMANLNAINLEGRVLIFPDDKTTKVETTQGKKSWDDYTKDKLGGGGYELVIGPQQPTYMGTWRQYAFTGGRGLWLMNTAKRFIAYDNNPV